MSVPSDADIPGVSLTPGVSGDSGGKSGSGDLGLGEMGGSSAACSFSDVSSLSLPIWSFCVALDWVSWSLCGTFP